MKNRLMKVLNHLGLTATRLADEIGVQRSGISHILSGRNQPGYDFIVKLLTRFPELNSEWLLLGKGNLLKDKDKSTTDINKSIAEPSLKSAKQQDLFSTTQIRDEDPEVYLTKNTQVTNVTFIDKVLLLHHDGTFQVYRQPGKD